MMLAFTPLKILSRCLSRRTTNAPIFLSTVCIGSNRSGSCCVHTIRPFLRNDTFRGRKLCFGQTPTLITTKFRVCQQLSEQQKQHLRQFRYYSSPHASIAARIDKTPRPRTRAPVIPDNTLPVQAIHIAQTIELKNVSRHLFGAHEAKPFGKNSIVFELMSPDRRDSTEHSVDSNSSSSNTNPPPAPPAPPQQQQQRFLAVFRFGSVVFFNVAEKEAAGMIRKILKYAAKDTVPIGMERREDFGVLVTDRGDSNDTTVTSATATPDRQSQQQEQRSSSSDNDLVVTGDYCRIPDLDTNGVAVISNIMAQTVALDSYTDKVDDLLQKFADINAVVTKTGSFDSSQKSFFFKTVAQNNAIFMDMINKIRIKDRSDTAWNLTKYETIHYGLKEEFEIDDRFENIEFKLNLIQKNAKFFLEVLHHQKSNNLEWIIVVLILAECILMCIEMSGKGETFFNTLSSLIPWNVGNGQAESSVVADTPTSHSPDVNPAHAS